MGLLSKITKTVKKAVNPVTAVKATVKATKAAAKVTVKAVSSPKAALNTALNPVAQAKLALKTTKTLSKPIPTAVNPIKQVKAAAKFNEKVRTAAEIMRLPSISATLDFKKAVTNPKEYIKGIGKGYKEDLSFAGQFYSAVKSKNFKGIVTQGASDTAKALGALGVPKSVTEKIESKATTLAAALPPPKAPDPPPAETPTEGQATGEPYIEGVTTPAEAVAVAEATATGGPPMLLLLGAAVVVLLFAMRR